MKGWMDRGKVREKGKGKQRERGCDVDMSGMLMV